MKSKEHGALKEKFQSLLEFDTEQEELLFDAKLIMFRFLSEVENLNPNVKIKKKELAEKLGTSASYITQLFRGDKIVNLITLAKIQKAYNITFEVKAIDNTNYEEKIADYSNAQMFVSYRQSVSDFGIDEITYEAPIQYSPSKKTEAV